MLNKVADANFMYTRVSRGVENVAGAHWIQELNSVKLECDVNQESREWFKHTMPSYT